MLAPLLLLGLWAAKTQILPVATDSLHPFQQVYLSVQSEALANIDTGGAFREIRKGGNPPSGKSDARFDAFTADGYPVTRITFLKYSGDSVFFLATVTKNAAEDDYVTVGAEQKSLLKVYADVDVESAKKAARERRESQSKKRDGHGAAASLWSQILILGVAIGVIVLITYWSK